METKVMQYSYAEAYVGNWTVRTYINGIVEHETIVAEYELAGYIERLKNDGYTYCYSSDEIEEYKREYLRYKELYEDAVAKPVYGYEGG